MQAGSVLALFAVTTGGVAVIVVVFVLAAACLLLGWAQARVKRARVRVLAGWAQRRGMAFSPAPDPTLPNRLPPLTPLFRGESRYAYNRAAGTQGGREALCFDFYYETVENDAPDSIAHVPHRFSAVVLRSHQPLHEMALRSERFLDRLGQIVGRDDIDFESAAFNREFWVQAADRRWAFDVIHQETMEALLASPRFAIEMRGDVIALWRDVEFSPVDFAAALTLGTAILDGIPRDGRAPSA